MLPETHQVIERLFDHLLSHPFFDTTIRRVLEIDPDADVTENDDYIEKLTQLIDQTLVAMIALNLSGTKPS